MQFLKSLFFILVVPGILFAESSYMNLTPGTSSRSDVERVLGAPVSAVTETLSEYGPQSNAGKIYVQYSPDSPIAERIELMLSQKSDRNSVLQSLGLPGSSMGTETAKGKSVEYFGAPYYIALTYSSEDLGSGVRRIGYYSKRLFDVGAANAKSNGGSTTTTPTTPRGQLGPDQDGYQFTNETATRLTYFQSPSVAHCRAECEKNPKCEAFGWIRPNGYVQGDPSMCYLMSAWKKMLPHPCCISAVRNNSNYPGGGEITQSPAVDSPSQGTSISDLKAPAVVTSSSFSPFTLKAVNSSGILKPNSSIMIMGQMHCGQQTVAYSSRASKVEAIDNTTVIVEGLFIPFGVPKGKCNVTLYVQDPSGKESNRLTAQVEFR